MIRVLVVFVYLKKNNWIWYQFLTCIILLYSNLIWTWNTRIILQVLGIYDVLPLEIMSARMTWCQQHHLSAPHSMAGPRPIIPGPNEKRLQNQFPKEVMKPQPSKQVWPVENAGWMGLSSYSFSVVVVVLKCFARNQCCLNQLTYSGLEQTMKGFKDYILMSICHVLFRLAKCRRSYLLFQWGCPEGGVVACASLGGHGLSLSLCELLRY